MKQDSSKKKFKTRAELLCSREKKTNRTHSFFSFSFRATVHIQVNDVNEYAPVFKEKSYKATVIEGKQYDSILRVEAVDADCSPQFSQICSYEIVTPDVPFAIDKDGKSEEQAFITRATVRGQVCTRARFRFETIFVRPFRQL